MAFTGSRGGNTGGEVGRGRLVGLNSVALAARVRHGLPARCRVSSASTVTTRIQFETGVATAIVVAIAELEKAAIATMARITRVTLLFI